MPASDVAGATVDFQSNARNPTAEVGCEELDVKAVLEKVNARRALQSDGMHNFEKSRCVGRVAGLEKGKL